jgi:hypothetical protein
MADHEESNDDRSRPEDGERRSRPPRQERRPRERARGVGPVVRGALEIVELTGKDLEGVVGVSRDGDTWKVRVEMVEMRRIPSTTDVLAIYEVDLDESANLVGYRRLERYVRGTPTEDRP